MHRDEWDDESDDEDDVWNDDGRNDGGQVLRIVVGLNHYPRIDFALEQKKDSTIKTDQSFYDKFDTRGSYLNCLILTHSLLAFQAFK